MVRTRTDDSERERLFTRLAISVNTLLRLRFRLPVPPHLGQPLPIRPPEALRLLRRLARRQAILDDTCSEENPAVVESETEMSDG
eukprot:2712588-Pyramimonas_sp.AAC.1